MKVLSGQIAVFCLVLGILFTSCRPAAPGTAAPENVSFRGFRLADARPAGFGYSVISDRRVWEQFLRDRTPSASRPSPETSQIDFKTRRSAIELAAGRLIGGYRAKGTYLVRGYGSGRWVRNPSRRKTAP
jgi:hypothetical protein